MADLGTLTPAATTPISLAYDVNAHGVIVGLSNVETGATDATRAFVYEPLTATMTDIGTLGGTNAAATAINDAGVVVGWSDVAGDGARHAFAYEPATAEMIDLGTFGGVDSEATDLNEQGLVVGFSETGGDADPFCAPACPLTRAFVHDLGAGSTTMLANALGDNSAKAWGINEDGVVVGTSVRFQIVCSHCPIPSRAVAWELGTTGVYTIAEGDYGASAINDAGVAVGTGHTNELFASIPFAFQGQVTYAPGA